MTVLTAALIVATFGIITAVIAARKGRSFLGWWLFGAALFIVALPWAILIGPNPRKYKRCPDCRSWVAREAAKCRHCGTDLTGLKVPPTPIVVENNHDRRVRLAREAEAAAAARMF
jgi:hypothetical protein